MPTALLPDKTSPPSLITIVRLRLTLFVTLALLSLVAAPRAKAQSEDIEAVTIYDFKLFLESEDTNHVGANTGGAGDVSKLFFDSAPAPPSGSISPHASSGGGTLYGTASLGGSSGQGTVFAIHTDGTGFTVLHNFTGGVDGGFPTAGLVSSSNLLYGTTVNGGNSDNGTVFALATNGTGFTVLHHFTARNQSPYTNSDGGNPYAALILSSNRLYGATSDGGTGNAGTVFALNLSNTNFTVLHQFTAANYDPDFNFTNNDGANPHAQLILSGATLYGTAMQGGNANGGTMFSIGTNGANFTNLHSFTGGSDGFQPAGELTLSTNTLFGTTLGGGNASIGNGTVFAINTNGTGFTVVHAFTAGNYDTNLPPIGYNLTNSDGAVPHAGLILSANTLYGTTSAGGSGANGTVFSISLLPSPPLTILGVSLSGTNLVIKGANGQSGGTYVTRLSTNLSLSPNSWTPVATNILNVSGNFTLTATNAVDPKAPRRFYILQAQ